MHSRDVLEHFGCTNARLRQICTSEGPSGDTAAVKSNGADSGGSSAEEALTTTGTRMVPYQTDTNFSDTAQATKSKPQDLEIRKRWENRIRSRVLTGIATGINNAKPLQAVDLSWDSQPIQKETVPLLMWAQGKIKVDDVCRYLTETCDPTTVAKFITKDKSGAQTINIPRICDIAIALPRSYVTRRHAALAALWDNLYPLLKYDPRGTSQVDQLQADVVTQLVDVMGEEYNYRHFLSQCDRDKLLYAQSLIFPRAAWDRKMGWKFEKSNVPGATKTKKAVSYVEQEGVDCVNPHPSRWFYDLGAPLANINTNNGPTYIGYWDIVPFGTVRNGSYFNVNRIVANEGWAQLLQMQQMYFAQYFDPCVLSVPTLGPCTDPAMMNDRTGQIGIYGSINDDKGVLLTQYFEKVNPKVEGIGDYDAEIWLRLTAAGDGTIVAAEFMPSIPACYGGINCNDNRVANASLASEMLAFQDQVSNILTTMNEQVRRSFTQLWVFNRDFLDEKIVKELTDNAANANWWIDPKVLTMSFSEKQELLAAGRFDPSMIMFKITMELQAAVSDGLRSIGQLLALADRLVNSSPNELGQPNPREVAAREVQEISTSIQSIYAFYNEGPREQRAAFKRMLYESMKCFAEDRFEVPVLGRYQLETIKKAGFDVRDKPKQTEGKVMIPAKSHIIGSLSDVDFDVQFTSRDGAERASNTQGAQVLQQLFQGLLQVPGVAEKFGPRRIFDALNIIARMAGAPEEFMVQLDDGESESMPGDPAQEGKMPPAVDKAIKEVMSAMQQLAVKDGKLEQVVAMMAEKLGIPMPPAGPAQGQPPGPAPQAFSGNAVPMASGAAPSGPPPAPNGAALLQNP